MQYYSSHLPFLLTKNLDKLALLVNLLIFSVPSSADIDILYRKEDVCEEAEFYSPYVRLLRTRQPHHEHSPILKSFKEGYIDVSRHTGILCINGPAIVYTDVDRDQKCTNDSSFAWAPSFGEPQIFSHDCFSFNRLPREEYKQPGQQDLKKESHVFGNKVFGVYLLGKFPDYRDSNFVFFPQSDFGYKPDAAWCIHDGASVAFLVNSSDTSTHCYSVKKYNMDGVLSFEYNGNPVFCFREDQDTDFDTPWHKVGARPLLSEDVEWETCGGSSSVPSPSAPKEYEPEPFQMPDFRMIHPKFWSSQGSIGVKWTAKRKTGEKEDVPIFSKPNPPGSLFPGEEGWKDPSEMIHFHIPGTNPFDLIITSDSDTTTVEPYQKFFVEIPEADCEEVPKPPDNCEEKFNNECMFLNLVLTLDEISWKEDKLKDGSWRLPILNIVNSIYVKACPQVTDFLAPALSRLFQYFLSQAVEKDPTLEPKFKQPRRREWTEMLTDLERCNEKAEMMRFFRKKDPSAFKLKKKLETKLNVLQQRIASRRAAAVAADDMATSSGLPLALHVNNPNHTADIMEIEKIQNHLNEFPLKFPYKILIGNPEKPEYAEASKVFQYREAAEIDHELDWALDTYWKVISTVLGFCNIHYASRDAATFMRLYDSFTEDFLEFVAKDWIKGDNRNIYEQLFGEFIYGSGVLWIDACHDGSYQWSNRVDMRPLRPLPLHEGDVPPGSVSSASISSPVPTNFFVDNPAFSGYVDDYDTRDNSDENVGVAVAVPESIVVIANDRDPSRNLIK